MTDPLSRSFSHFCVCVSNIKRSATFYCDALGFRRTESFRVGNEVAKLTQIDGEVDLLSQYLSLGQTRLELWQFLKPETLPRQPQPMHMIGLTHLAIRVDDLDFVIAKVVACGGTLLPETRTLSKLDGFESEILYVLDPDGVRVELLWMPAHMSLA